MAGVGKLLNKSAYLQRKGTVLLRFFKKKNIQYHKLLSFSPQVKKLLLLTSYRRVPRSIFQPMLKEKKRKKMSTCFWCPRNWTFLLLGGFCTLLFTAYHPFVYGFCCENKVWPWVLIHDMPHPRRGIESTTSESYPSALSFFRYLLQQA